MGYSDFIQDGKHWVSREAGSLHYAEELMDLVTFFFFVFFSSPSFSFFVFHLVVGYARCQGCGGIMGFREPLSLDESTRLKI